MDQRHDSSADSNPQVEDRKLRVLKAISENIRAYEELSGRRVVRIIHEDGRLDVETAPR